MCVYLFFFGTYADGVSLVWPPHGGTDPIAVHLMLVRLLLLADYVRHFERVYPVTSTLVHILKQSLAAPF